MLHSLHVFSSHLSNSYVLLKERERQKQNTLFILLREIRFGEIFVKSEWECTITIYKNKYKQFFIITIISELNETPILLETNIM